MYKNETKSVETCTDTQSVRIFVMFRVPPCDILETKERRSIGNIQIDVSIMAVAFRFESVPGDVTHKDINIYNHSVDVYY